MAEAQISNRTRAGIRIGLGLAQGIALWLVTRGISPGADTGWLSDHPPWFVALLIPVGLAPLAVLAGLGQMRKTTLSIWSAVAAVLLFAAGWWIGWKATPEVSDTAPLPIVVAPIAVALFIAHHLIAVADEHCGWMAPYPRYFALASKHIVQLGLAVAFTGVFWILLLLGSELFHILGIDGFRTLISKGWFMWPATATVFAIAVEVTDARAGLVLGIRTLGLTLLSWLTPLMAAIAAAFLASMVFTGLKPLFDTGNAAEIVLAAAAALIVLTNATYQDGQGEETRPLVLRWGVRLAAVLVIPLVALAAYALVLRIGQHGLTPERVIASAMVAIGAAFAIGYAWAAVRRGPWMKGLERTNVLTGYFALAVLVLILSPVLDPQRISVSNQVARLNSGKVAADKFDYKFLRFRAGRPGLDALKRLSESPSGPHSDQIAQRAREAQKLGQPFEDLPVDLTSLTVVPAGRTLPPELSKNALATTGDCRKGDTCVALFADLDGDGVEEIALIGQRVGQVYALHAGKWQSTGMLNTVCPGDASAIANGAFTLAPSKLREIQVGQSHLQLSSPWPMGECPGDPKGGGASVTVPIEERLDVQLVKPRPPPNPSASAPPASPAPRAPAPPAGR